MWLRLQWHGEVMPAYCPLPPHLLFTGLCALWLGKPDMWEINELHHARIISAPQNMSRSTELILKCILAVTGNRLCSNNHWVGAL